MKNCDGHRSRSNGKKGKVAMAADDAAVEELLRSAQDEMMLKLSLDSHISKLPKDSLPSDLRCRFDALKSVPAPSNNSSSSSSRAAGVPEPTQKDLMARFDALRGKNDGAAAAAPVVVSGIIDEDDEEDEVEKIIRWAKDAARLDPSPPSDSDDSDDGDLSD